VEDKRAVSANLGEILGKTLFFLELSSCPPLFLSGRTQRNCQKMADSARNMAVAKPDSAAKLRLAQAEEIYGRGKGVNAKSARDKKLRANLKKQEYKHKEAILQAKDAEILLEHTEGFLEPETELEKTYKVRQDEIQESVGIETAKKGFELKLPDMGPYRMDYSRNGRDLLLAGRKGHVATMDWREGKLGCELQLNETVRDARWLHNNQFFAVAQKKHTYIYDHQGVELHCLSKHLEPLFLEFLPYHFLLASAVSTLLYWISQPQTD
jgi:U3 small nucleolar RNA-associated protein 7